MNETRARTGLSTDPGPGLVVRCGGGGGGGGGQQVGPGGRGGLVAAHCRRQYPQWGGCSGHRPQPQHSYSQSSLV